MAYMKRIFEDITPERFRRLRGRFDQFVENLDKDVPVIRVYEPLKKQQLDQLEVVREISVVLQQKKEEDVLKAKQAAEEASRAAEEAEKKEGTEETVEGKEGEGVKETEKENVPAENQKEIVQSLYKA